MAKRRYKKFRRVDSQTVQGKGSYVIMRSPGFEDFFGDIDFDELAGNKYKAAQAIIPMLYKFIDKWDWVDDEGKPLPQPSEDPDIIGKLSFPEQEFLIDALDLGDTTNLKN
jgi:hypothetical protein